MWAGVNTTAALAASAVAIGLFELYHLVQAPLPRTLVALGVAGGALFVIEAAIGASFRPELTAGVVLVPLFVMALSPQRERSPAAWAWVVAGALLMGWTLSLAVLVRDGPQGREWALTLLILTFGVDTGAYLVGRALGRRKLAPSISPGKTWEGAVGGLALGAGASMAAAAGFDLDVQIWQAAMVGLLVAVAAQLGDLAESVLKRAAGAKDAGGIMPGHGGLLDRLDSLIPATAVLYFSLQFLGR